MLASINVDNAATIFHEEALRVVRTLQFSPGPEPVAGSTHPCGYVFVPLVAELVEDALHLPAGDRMLQHAPVHLA